MTKTRDFWVSDAPDEAIRKMKLTLNRLGQLVRVEPGQYIEGKIRFGVQDVTLKLHWAEEEAKTKLDTAVRGGKGPTLPALVGTRWTIEAEADDKTGTAQQNAVERLEDAYLHFDSPDYKPDRAGLLPFTIIGIIILVVLVLFLIFRDPKMRKALPNLPTPASATPTPDEAG